MSPPPADEDPRRRIAVALTYEAPSAPRVVATGRGPIADAIVAEARASGVAIEQNPVLADALSRIELDAEIPEELYRAVAEVIAFVIRARDRIR
ncbi:EscU/YscU/HrcU family type III secretion system export apparatus switch protein [Prosthecodimorpha staleyi]|uniref:EscU/YscU/HrcU family type III secretion system export apparatus switch protein n=1 Tax=Prosthecodimorpha staleyi TaxID=2840188 RepID=A0A947D4F6_9HYPH|nr:EscU/YscU/HrcU family type III secretion system export apparatus switch protein [Prosthecodimorpha staleyi]MBT9288012.1 EscU/YscU/HrcU family type III secretion system export apparatus switch protein [Prosthecodimorpha staleyi]